MTGRHVVYKQGLTEKDLSQKAGADLLQHISRLTIHPLLSKPWLAVYEAAVHVFNVALLDHSWQERVDGTVWDGDALAVRFLLEAGMANPLVRILQATHAEINQHVRPRR